MKNSSKKPKIFIGSSTEADKIGIITALVKNIQHFSHPNSWKNSFSAGEIIISSLEKKLSQCDFAIFILTPDDLVKSRRKLKDAIRDNVLFEVGLFMGRLGKEKVFMIRPLSAKIVLPSDLNGITVGTYDDENSDIETAVAPFCADVKNFVESITKQENNEERFSLATLPEGIIDKDITYNIQVLNHRGDAVVIKRITLFVENLDGNEDFDRRNHEIYSTFSEQSFSDIQLVAWREDLKPMTLKRISDSPKRKEFQVIFNPGIQEEQELTYYYRYQWRELFSKNDSFFDTKVTSRSKKINLIIPSTWELINLEVNAFDLIRNKKPLQFKAGKQSGMSIFDGYKMHSFSLDKISLNLEKIQIWWDWKEN